MDLPTSRFMSQKDSKSCNSSLSFSEPMISFNFYWFIQRIYYRPISLQQWHITISNSSDLEGLPEVSDQHHLRTALQVLLQPAKHLVQLTLAQQLLQLHDRRLVQVFVSVSAVLGLELGSLLLDLSAVRPGSLNYLIVLLLKGLQHVLHRKLRYVPFLLLQYLLSLGSSKEVYITRNGNLLGHKTPVEYLALKLQISLLPNVVEQRLPLPLVLSTHLMPVVLVEDLQHLQIHHKHHLPTVVVRVLSHDLPFQGRKFKLGHLPQLIDAITQVKEQLLLALETVPVDLRVVDRRTVHAFVLLAVTLNLLSYARGLFTQSTQLLVLLGLPTVLSGSLLGYGFRLVLTATLKGLQTFELYFAPLSLFLLHLLLEHTHDLLVVDPLTRPILHNLQFLFLLLLFLRVDGHRIDGLQTGH